MNRSLCVACCLLGLLSFALVGCGGQAAKAPTTPSKLNTSAASTPAPKPVDPPKDVKPEGAAPAQAATGMAAPAPASQPSGDPLTKDTLVGKSFTAGPYQLGFEKDGVLKVKMGDQTMDGTWSIDGNSVTISAMGQEHKAEINGSQLMYNGKALEPVK